MDVKRCVGYSEAARGRFRWRAGCCVSDPNPLLETAESLASTTRELKRIAPDEWLTLEETAAYLKKTPKAFEKVVARGEIPKHYLTERGILFSRKELGEWLMGR